MNARASIPYEDEVPARGSYSMAIRNRLMREALQIPYFIDFMPVLTEGLPIDPQNLPILGCYLGEETMVAWGHPAAGGLKFIVNVRMNWSILIEESDKEEADRRLDGAYVALTDWLFRNPSLTSLADTFDPVLGYGTEYNARFYVTNSRTYVRWGAYLLDNKTPVAERPWEITLQYGRDFSPRLDTDLDEVHVETSFPSWRTPEERERIQQIRQRVILTPASPRT
jgi:hypothetical protein